jgi:hypothetical protein
MSEGPELADIEFLDWLRLDKPSTEWNALEWRSGIDWGNLLWLLDNWLHQVWQWLREFHLAELCMFKEIKSHQYSYFHYVSNSVLHVKG